MKKLLFSFVMLAFAAAMYAQPYAVTFRVDMRGNVPPAGGKVTVTGDFGATATPPVANWTQGIMELTDPDGNLVYEGTFQLAGGPIQYKFGTSDAAGANTQWEGNIPPSNRTATIAAATTLPIHCYSVDGVGNCPLGPPDTVNVTIKIDFTRQFVIVPGGPQNGIISIAGSIQPFAVPVPAAQWTEGATVMMPSPGSAPNTMYEAHFRMAEGTYEYKSLFGNHWGFDESPVGPCSNGNRILIVPGTRTGQTTGSYTDGPYCFGSCFTCAPIGPKRDVIFTVETFHQTPGLSYNLDGTFNTPSFDPNHSTSLPMTAVTPTTSSAIFTKTVNIYPGDYVYLFSEYDGSAYTDESFLGGSACTVSVALGAKRRPVSIPVGNGPYVVDTYEFDSCIMVATENEKANAAYFQVAPNPFTGSARVSFSNEANSTFGLTMTDVAGKTVRSMNGLSGNSVVIEQGTLITGVYFVTLTTANGARFTQKLILQ